MEQDLIIELCKIEGSNRNIIMEEIEKQPDYINVLGQLHMHRVAAAALYVLKKQQLLGQLNREFRSSLNAVYQYNQYRVDSYRKALEMMADVLEGEQFPYAILKGGVLVSMYPMGVRTSNDVDLLVLRRDIPVIVECFRRAGFVQGFIRNGKLQEASRSEIINAQLNRGEIIPFIKKVDLPAVEYLEVDINVSLDEKALENTDVIEQMLERRKELSIGQGKKLSTLENIDFLIHLCVHLYKEATVYQWVQMGRDLSLYKFLDIYLYYKRYAKTLWNERLVERVRAYGLEKECFYAFYYTGELFDKEHFNTLIEGLSVGKPGVYECLNLVYNPADKCYYRFRDDFKARIFSGDRKEMLEVVADAEVKLERKW